MSKIKQSLVGFRDLPADELKLALDRARDEYFRLKLGQHTNQVENSSSIRAKRREIARIQTVLADRASQASQKTAAPASAAGKDR